MKKFQCSTCFEYYATPTTLKRHETTVHKSILPVACPQCEGRFRDQYCLRLHLKKHAHDQNGKKRADEEEQEADIEWPFTGEEEEELKPECALQNGAYDAAAPRVPKPQLRKPTQPRRHWRPDRFECYVCESQFDTAEYRTHMRDHADDLRETKDQLSDMLQKYSGTAEKINATISSFLAQDE